MFYKIANYDDVVSVLRCVTVKKGDLAGIAAGAHDLKGMCANFRMEDIRILALELELAVKNGAAKENMRGTVTRIEEAFLVCAQSL